jgi:hypothetical protein
MGVEVRIRISCCHSYLMISNVQVRSSPHAIPDSEDIRKLLMEFFEELGVPYSPVPPVPPCLDFYKNRIKHCSNSLEP